jgi:hypothetical protein
MYSYFTQMMEYTIAYVNRDKCVRDNGLIQDTVFMRLIFEYRKRGILIMPLTYFQSILI